MTEGSCMQMHMPRGVSVVPILRYAEGTVSGVLLSYAQQRGVRLIHNDWYLVHMG